MVGWRCRCGARYNGLGEGAATALAAHKALGCKAHAPDHTIPVDENVVRAMKAEKEEWNAVHRREG